MAVRGRLRVNVDPLFSSLLLGPQLGAFMTEHPELELELISRDRLGDMVADGFDLAVRFGEPRNSSLIARPLFDTRILTVASPAYLQKHALPQTPQDLLQHACIQFRNPETGRPFDWEFHCGDRVVQVPVKGQIPLTMCAPCMSCASAATASPRSWPLVLRRC
jgi:DNA-binding transcriptional LysR family regulator